MAVFKGFQGCPKCQCGGGQGNFPAEGPKKKKVTPPQFEVEVVSSPPVAIVATSDEFEMCLCPGENAHTTNSNAKFFRTTPSEEF